MRNQGKGRRWKAIHKWLGLALTLFLVPFCISGIILNHRDLVSRHSVNRSLLPPAYHIRNFNNGVIKGTLPLPEGRLLAYGSTGVWLTDPGFRRFSDFNNGLPEGVDNRNIRSLASAADGSIWCAAQSGLFRFHDGKWRNEPLPGNRERVSDVVAAPDGKGVVVLTRSALYIPKGDRLVRKELPAPPGFDGKITLFKTVWHLHSGALFGTAGRILVDAVAIVILFLCITGLLLWLLPKSMRRSSDRRRLSLGKGFRWNFRWHRSVGYVTLILTLVISVTGMCLRPPLMVPLVLTKTLPFPGTDSDSPNPWHDRLRTLRWNPDKNGWLLSTSEGFFLLAPDFSGSPEPVDPSKAPPMSPMGVTVLERTGEEEWLVGSFSGLYRWDTRDGSVRDYFTGKRYRKSGFGKPISDHLVAGFSRDLRVGETVFDHSSGSDRNLRMPAILERQPLSLWNAALEVHTGRVYSSLMGPVSVLFIFLAGASLTLVLVSGLILHRRLHGPRRQ